MNLCGEHVQRTKPMHTNGKHKVGVDSPAQRRHPSVVGIPKHLEVHFRQGCLYGGGSWQNHREIPNVSATKNRVLDLPKLGSVQPGDAVAVIRQ